MSKLRNIRRSKVYGGLPAEEWPAYKARLINPDAHTLADIVQWLSERGCRVGVTVVHRDRRYELARAEQFRAAREYTEHMLRLANAEGWDVSRLNAQLAGQKLFDALNGLDGLTPESASQAIRLLEATALLRSSESKARLVDLQAQNLQRKIDEFKATADARASQALKARGLDELAIEEIRSIYGLPPVKEMTAA